MRRARSGHSRLANLRRQLSHLDALPQLTLLGIVVGCAAALVIIAFRVAVSAPLTAMIGEVDNFERLSQNQRFLVPAIGALIIGIGLQLLPKHLLKVGVAHVLDRLHNHQGYLPWPNVLVQFFGGVLLLITGQSVGREGPAVHLGAGAASLVGQSLKLPNNSMRVLLGAGVAAAISAAFNTPLAGVVFAMEVVLMEYTIAGFIPIILASFAGSLLSRLVLGPEVAFSIQTVQLNQLTELPYMVASGIALGAVAIAYSYSLQLGRFVDKWPIVVRITLAGIFTGLVATQVPQVLGIGYDTLAQAMTGQLSLQLLLILLVSKILTTGVSLSAGMPGGLIGPTLFIGGVAGAALSVGSQWLYAEQASFVGFYVLLGMAAMLGAVLNAPLTALITILELTNNPNIIFPSMLVVVIACLSTRIVVGNKGIFITLLGLQGKSVRSSALSMELNRVGVYQVIDTDFVKTPFIVDFSKAVSLLEGKPRWLVLTEPDKPKKLLKAADLAKHLNELQEEEQQPEEIHLIDIPGEKTPLPPIHEAATLWEAHEYMKTEATEAVYVKNPRQFSLDTEILGLVTKEAITNYYSV